MFEKFRQHWRHLQTQIEFSVLASFPPMFGAVTGFWRLQNQPQRECKFVCKPCFPHHTVYFQNHVQQIVHIFVPRPFHLQSLITCSVQIRKGKAWEIWSCVVTSGRERIDTWGVVPTVIIPSNHPEQQSMLMLPC